MGPGFRGWNYLDFFRIFEDIRSIKNTAPLCNVSVAGDSAKWALALSDKRPWQKFRAASDSANAALVLSDTSQMPA